MCDIHNIRSFVSASPRLIHESVNMVLKTDYSTHTHNKHIHASTVHKEPNSDITYIIHRIHAYMPFMSNTEQRIAV